MGLGEELAYYLFGIGHSLVQIVIDNDMVELPRLRQLELGLGHTFVYRLGISNNRHSFATAAGLFNSAVGAVLLILSDQVAKRLGEQGLI